MGLPVISTNWSGTTAFLDGDVGYPLPIAGGYRVLRALVRERGTCGWLPLPTGSLRKTAGGFGSGRIPACPLPSWLCNSTHPHVPHLVRTPSQGWTLRRPQCTMSPATSTSPLYWCLNTRPDAPPQAWSPPRATAPACSGSSRASAGRSPPCPTCAASCGTCTSTRTR